MADKARSIDYAEWYKRLLVTLITIMVGGILSIGSDMKGDLKVALYKSEDNKVNHAALVVEVHDNYDSIASLDKRVCDIEEVIQ